jgi:hypothetical protein
MIFSVGFCEAKDENYHLISLRIYLAVYPVHSRDHCQVSTVLYIYQISNGYLSCARYGTDLWNTGHRVGDQFVHMVFDTDPLTDAPGLTDLDQDARLELESRVFVPNLLHSVLVVYFA